jgi:hypothetical protein
MPSITTTGWPDEIDYTAKKQPPARRAGGFRQTADDLKKKAGLFSPAL